MIYNDGMLRAVWLSASLFFYFGGLYEKNQEKVIELVYSAYNNSYYACSIKLCVSYWICAN